MTESGFWGPLAAILQVLADRHAPMLLPPTPPHPPSSRSPRPIARFRRRDRQPAGGRRRDADRWYMRYREAIDTQARQEQTIAVRWMLRVLRTIPLTPWWVQARRQRNRREMRETEQKQNRGWSRQARRQRNRREMREHLRRYYAQGQ
jgi:hypothetical protein